MTKPFIIVDSYGDIYIHIKNVQYLRVKDKIIVQFNDIFKRSKL